MKLIKISLFIVIIAIISQFETSCNKQVDNSADIASLKASVASLNKTTDSLKKRTDSLAAALALTNQNLGNLTDTVNSIKIQLVNITGQITSLNNELLSTNANITVIQGQIATLTTQYQALLTQLNAIIAKLNAASIASLSNGLVAWYPFTGNANDSSGNGNNGTVNGATLTTDRFGNANSAFAFNGINNSISVPNSPSLNITGNQISISYWIKSSNSLNDGNFYGISKGGYDIGSGYEFCVRNTYHHDGVDNGDIELMGAYGGYAVPNWNQYSNKWVHLAAVFNNGIAQIYVNGILNNSVQQGLGISNLISNSYPLMIGTRTQGNFNVGWLNGSMDEIGIWNRPLTQTEITYLAAH